MASMWMPGAKTRPAPRDGGSMIGGPKMVTWHYFVAPENKDPYWGAGYLNDHGTSVHFTFNIQTGEWVQMIPVNRAGRGLKNLSGGIQTNRYGTYNIQIEVMSSSPDWWERLTPEGLAGLAKGMAYFRALGIPDQWAGQPGKDDDTPNAKSGHTGHRNWQENDHTDFLSKAPWELVAAYHSSSLQSIQSMVTPTTPGGSLRQNAMPIKVTGKLDGPTVILWQKYLTQAGGFDFSEHGGIDGVLGTFTISCWQVYMAQKLKITGIGKADGIFGFNTARATEKALKSDVTPIEAKVPGWYPGLIRDLQDALNLWVTKGTEIRL